MRAVLRGRAKSFREKQAEKKKASFAVFFLFLLCSFFLLAWVICTKSPVRSSDHFFLPRAHTDTGSLTIRPMSLLFERSYMESI